MDIVGLVLVVARNMRIAMEVAMTDDDREVILAVATRHAAAVMLGPHHEEGPHVAQYMEIRC